jgi:hypothetical protein
MRNDVARGGECKRPSPGVVAAMHDAVRCFGSHDQTRRNSPLVAKVSGNRLLHHSCNHPWRHQMHISCGMVSSRMESDLQRVHRVKHKQAEHIAEKVRSWPNLIEYVTEAAVLSRLQAPISQIFMYSDWLLCRLDPTCCCKVLRSTEAMRKHRQSTHNWSVASKGGRPSQFVQRSVQVQVEKSCSAVHCQRLFV